MNQSHSVNLGIGLAGTGYAAKLRAEALMTEARAKLVAIAGHDFERTQLFSQTYQAIAYPSWQDLLNRPDIDLVIIATINQDHGKIARAALQAGKHVVIEYPLALDLAEAQETIALAKAQNKLLHVEHIELLGGVHQALKASLPLVGKVFYARYATIKPERPAPQRWSYHYDQFGFPLVGALSRLHRLIDLFGAVTHVTCQAQFWTPDSRSPISYYTSCLCTAHLHFQTGLLAEVTYGKGAALWEAERKFAMHGDQGALVMDADQGRLITAAGSQAIAVGGRRGLFARDTAMVIDHLLAGTPLYITPEASLYTLKVADATRRAAETRQTIAIE
ncbi:Gfo/Idh/MocA family protein [Leptodesmis sp.]|uniref:Gfo/Idh/MocA family protein n=1 Tax=Leptodesmis sp. TaxID=3100501 RepID=UPI004053586E